MDAFEQIVKTALIHDGYWVIQGFKVNLTKEEKVQINRPSSPRWEIDLVAYKPSLKTLVALECKSYLDSNGVDFSSMQTGSKLSGRYKLFSEEVLRKIVFRRMKMQMLELGMITEDTNVTLGLAAGKVYSTEDDQLINEWFKSQGWVYYSPLMIKAKIKNLSMAGYYDDISIVTAKILERN